MKLPIKDVRNVKARRVSLTRKGFGGGARSAKVPDEGRDFRAKLILAPDVAKGKQLAEMMSWPHCKVAIITNPEHLKGVAIYPNEDILMVMGSDDGFLEQIQTAATMFCPGESFNLKMYAL